MFTVNITGKYIMYINILMVGTSIRALDGFCSYYRPLSATAFSVGAASVDVPYVCMLVCDTLCLSVSLS